MGLDPADGLGGGPLDGAGVTVGQGDGERGVGDADGDGSDLRGCGRSRSLADNHDDPGVDGSRFVRTGLDGTTTELSSADYAAVRALGDEYLKRNPRSLC